MAMGCLWLGLVGGGGTFLFVPFRALSGPFSSAYYRGEFGVQYYGMVQFLLPWLWKEGQNPRLSSTMVHTSS